MTTALSPSSARVLAAIIAFLDQHHYSPSIPGIAKRLGYHGVGGVVHHLRKLRDQGYITFEDGLARSIVVLRRDP